MTIAKITTPGLTAMGVSVILLWGCLIGEQVLVRGAAREQTRVLQEIDQLRQGRRDEPVAAPVPQQQPIRRIVKG